MGVRAPGLRNEGADPWIYRYFREERLSHLF